MTSAFRHVAGRQVKKIVVVVAVAVARHNDTARMRRPYKRKRVKSEIADPVNVSLPGCRSTSNEFHIFRV